MKNLVTVGLFLLSFLSYSQEGAIVSMHAVFVEGDLEAFEKVETVYMSKVAQKAALNGDIGAWNFLKVYRSDNLNDEQEYNYMFVQSAPDLDSFLSDRAAWWNMAQEVLSKKELNELTELQSKFTWKKDVRVIYRLETGIWNANDSSDYLNSFIQFNFAKPISAAAFIDENRTLWKPFFMENSENMNLLSWGAASKIHPTNGDWASVMSWDMFKSLKDLFKYRLGAGIEWPSESKMADIMPNGFTQTTVLQWLAGASSN